MGCCCSKHVDTPNEVILTSTNYIGLDNLGSTSFLNSVIQALYYCPEFRSNMLQYNGIDRTNQDNLLTCLADLFHEIDTNTSTKTSISPKKMLNMIHKEKEEYEYDLEQDAHEFLWFFISYLEEILLGNMKTINSASSISLNQPTWIASIFYGAITIAYKCLNCETVTCSSEEMFSTLRVHTENITRVDNTLPCFDNTELLRYDNKYNCQECRSWQNGEKREYLTKLPNILVLHLTRFKYVGGSERFTKLRNKVDIPLYLTPPNSCKGDSSEQWELIGAVMHCTNSINEYHYNTIVKTDNTWVLFDDDRVEKIDESKIQDHYSDTGYDSSTAYILFYKTAP